MVFCSKSFLNTISTHGDGRYLGTGMADARPISPI